MQKQSRRELCRDRNRKRSSDRLHLFQINGLQYLDIGEMSTQFQNCGAMYCSVERRTDSSEKSSNSSNCYQKGRCSLPPFSEAPSFLQLCLTSAATHNCLFIHNIGTYNTALSMRAILYAWWIQGPALHPLTQRLLCKGKYTIM